MLFSHSQEKTAIVRSRRRCHQDRFGTIFAQGLEKLTSNIITSIYSGGYGVYKSSVRQPRRRGLLHQAIIWQSLSRKLHENERNWTKEGWRQWLEILNWRLICQFHSLKTDRNNCLKNGCVLCLIEHFDLKHCYWRCEAEKVQRHLIFVLFSHNVLMQASRKVCTSERFLNFVS